MKITARGVREDLNSYFETWISTPNFKSAHHPFLVFTKVKGGIEVLVIEAVKHVLEYPDTTVVMNQWPGQWSSHFFKFTVGELKAYMVDNESTAVSYRRS